MISVQYLEQQRNSAATDHLLALLQHKPAPYGLRGAARGRKPIEVVVNRNAQTALRGLTREDYKAVNLSIHRLRVSPPSILRNVNDKLNSRAVYLRDVGNLTMLLSVVNNEILVEDIFERSRLPQILRYNK